MDSGQFQIEIDLEFSIVIRNKADLQRRRLHTQEVVKLDYYHSWA